MAFYPFGQSMPRAREARRDDSARLILRGLAGRQHTFLARIPTARHVTDQIDLFVSCRTRTPTSFG
jgi:hypothetical protein